MKKANRGFTLFEILVVISVFGMIALMASGMFFTILRGSARTKVLTEVKQNGNYAMGVMERMIRNARRITINSGGLTCEPSGMNRLKIVNPDGGETEFRCEADQISSNSASLTSDKVMPFDCSFGCEEGERGAIPDKVTINFSLCQAGEETRIEEETTVDFQAVVTLRNY